MLIQLISLIDALYIWAEFWAKKYDEGNNCYGCLLIFATILMYATTGIVLYYSFKFFWVSGCGFNKFILIVISLSYCAFTILIVLQMHPRGSLVTSGAISIYGALLAWTAFVSYPNKVAGVTCNPIIGSVASMYLQLATGLLIGLICTFYWSVSGKPARALEEAGVQNIVKDPENQSLKSGSVS